MEYVCKNMISCYQGGLQYFIQYKYIFFAFFAWLQGMKPADYLDVDSPFQRGNKKSKKRRKVERNTKLSRSLDSLKELHGK